MSHQMMYFLRPLTQRHACHCVTEWHSPFPGCPCACCLPLMRVGGGYGEGRKAHASLRNRLAVCSWLEQRSSQRGAPGPCQGRRLFGNSVWQAEGSHAGTDTDAAILSGTRLKRISPTSVESPHPRLSSCQTTNQSHVWHLPAEGLGVHGCMTHPASNIVRMLPVWLHFPIPPDWLKQETGPNSTLK